MAFESLTDKLQNVFKKLRSKGRLTEEDVKIALKEVKMVPIWVQKLTEEEFKRQHRKIKEKTYEFSV